jgi:hypothetical protein
MKRMTWVLYAVLLMSAPAAVSAQKIDPRESEAPVRDTVQPSPLRPLRIAKWTAVAGSAGAAAYGFFTNARADDRFRELERACQSDPVRCRDRLPDSRYRDPALEAEYQEILDLDRRSRRALIGGQIGIAASVVLFLLDLGNERRPPDIPYTPRLDVAPTGNGGIEVRLVWAH